MRTNIIGSRLTLNQKLQIKGYVYLIPFVLYFVLFILFPLGYSFVLSFMKYNLLTGQRKFIGVSNYLELFSDNLSYKVLLNTVYFAVPVIAGWLLLGLVVALLLNRKIPGMNAYRFFAYVPVVIDWIIVSLVWTFIFDPTFGLANYLLGQFGLPAHKFLQSSTEAMPTLILTALWKGFGYYAIFFLAGLQDVPQELYDAAEIDGASSFRTFWSVTLPQLAPVTAFIVMMAFINAFQFFAPFYMMTEGGPARSTTVLIYRFYEVSFGYMQMGRGSTWAVVFTTLVFLLLLVVRRSLSRTAGTNV